MPDPGIEHARGKSSIVIGYGAELAPIGEGGGKEQPHRRRLRDAAAAGRRAVAGCARRPRDPRTRQVRKLLAKDEIVAPTGQQEQDFRLLPAKFRFGLKRLCLMHGTPLSVPRLASAGAMVRFGRVVGGPLRGNKIF